QSRVAVLIETATSWGRQAIRGIVDYVRSRSHWAVRLHWYGNVDFLPLPGDWAGEGIIARVTTRTLARQIESLGVPAVNVSRSTVPESRVPQVTSDDVAVSRLAAEHFLERGFR